MDRLNLMDHSNNTIKRLASILGTLCSMAGLSLSIQACETPKLYGPPPPQDEGCCGEFNGQFYERCIKEYQDKGVCIADELRKELPSKQ